MTVLGTQPPTDREVLIGNPMLECPAEGWDTLRERLWLPHQFWLQRGTVREGPGPEGGTFIVQDFRTVDWWAGRPVVEVTSMGIATQDGKSYKLGCSSSVSEDFSLAAAPWYSIWRKGYPSVTKLWVSLTKVNIFDHVGVASLPPETYGVSPTLWNMAWLAADDWSAVGWIGESRNVQQLPGSEACLVTDTWLCDLGYSDRDGTPVGIIYL